jgi:feruloyl-CoA synthase
VSVLARGKKDVPLRPVKLGTLTALVDRKSDGTIHISVKEPLADYPPTYNHSLEYWANKTPDTVFLAHRGADGEWRKLTYAQVLARVKRVASGLLTRDLSAERPIVILSGNGIEHALLALAAMHVGIPYAPVSPAYSLMSSDFGKLKYIIELLTPGLVYASDGAMFGKAIDAAVPQDCELFVGQNPPARGAKTFGELEASDGKAVDAAHAKVGHDHIAKFLFTSGSTGTPKAVINTHRMLTSNQAMLSASLAFVKDEPPVIVDWLPWSHTFGSNHNFGLVITNGGTLYIDDGNPTPPGVPKTARNLREVAPTIYFNVPKGFEALVTQFRADPALRDNFFSKLKVLFYAGAALSQQSWDDLEALAAEAIGQRVIFISSLGSTETAPAALACTWDSGRPGNIGLPLPGVELKLIPNEGKLEARLKGPHISPGCWRQDELTRNAFDSEGYYKLGDALKFADPSDPGKGLLFDGRIAEDFKLSTGTWVSVGPLRARFLDHFAPYARDVVIAGADRDDLAVLVFPDIDACRKLCPDITDAAPPALLADRRVRDEFAKRLTSLAKESPGSSARICRLALLEVPPSMDVGEATDKGSINQRTVLKHRAALVEELYAKPCPARVISI